MKWLQLLTCLCLVGCSADSRVGEPAVVETTIPLIISSPAKFTDRVVSVEGCLVVSIHFVILFDCADMAGRGLHLIVKDAKLSGDIGRAMEFHPRRRMVKGRFIGLFKVADSGRNTLTYQRLTGLSISEP
jgi:hypothetical protein